MRARTTRLRTLRGVLAIGVALLSAPILAAVALAGGGGQSQLAAVRAATAAFHDIEKAKDAGYAEFHVCTDEAGAGAMGQHYVNLGLVLNPEIDPLKPEALVYEPRRGGGYKLVGVEWVVFQADWHAANGASMPSVLGRDLKPVDAGNRYGLDPFYQRHAWIWKPNPRGMFDDWNSRVSCRGQGDAAGG